MKKYIWFLTICSMLGFLTTAQARVVSTQDATKIPIIADANVDLGAFDFAATDGTFSGVLQAETWLSSYENVVYVAKSGADYSTFQSALDGTATDSTLFLVAPGTYDGDTISFTANNQCVVGLGLTPQQLITNTSTIVNFGAYTGCKIQNVKAVMTVTGVDDLMNGSGSLGLRDVHLETIASGSIAGVPTVINTTGTIKMKRGSVVYNNTAASSGQVKAGIIVGAGGEVELRRVEIDVDGAGASTAISLGYSAGTGVLNMYKCRGTINDTDSNSVIGLANLAGSGDHEFFSNDIHVTCGAAKAGYGFFGLSGTTLGIRTMFNHIHVVAGAGGTADAFYYGANTTITSQFDDIIAADGNSDGGGTFVCANSPTDGGLCLSEDLDVDTIVVYSNDQIRMTGAFVHIGDGGTVDYADGDGDLYIEDELEVDGECRFGKVYSTSHIHTAGYFNSTSPNNILTFNEGIGGAIGWLADDGWHFSLNSTDGVVNNNLIITTWANSIRDHDHDTLSANPTMFFHSATHPDTDNTQWGSITHDKTDMVIGTGTGNVKVTSPIYQSGAAGNVLTARKFTVGHADLTDADTSEDITLFTIPAGGRIVDVYAYVTTALTGGSVSALTMAVGDTDPDGLSEEHDVLGTGDGVWILEGQNGTDKGDYLYDDTVFMRAKIYTSATAVKAQFVSTSDNLVNLDAGSIDIYVLYSVAE